MPSPKPKIAKELFCLPSLFCRPEKQNQVDGKYGIVVARMKGVENPAGNNVSYVIGQIVVI